MSTRIIGDMLIAAAAQYKAWGCGHSLSGTAGSNSAGGMDVCVLWVLSDRGWSLVQRSPTDWCVWVWSWRVDNEEAVAYWELWRRGGKVWRYFPWTRLLVGDSKEGILMCTLCPSVHTTKRITAACCFPLFPFILRN
jgi:hypothetical protein